MQVYIYIYPVNVKLNTKTTLGVGIIVHGNIFTTVDEKMMIMIYFLMKHAIPRDIYLICDVS